MFKHFLRISLRNLARNRVYSTINILGLAVGMAGFVIVLLYLNHELSYDTWNPELKKVYRVSAIREDEPQEQTPAPLAHFLKQNIPNIETATRIQSAGEMEVPLRAGETTIYEKGSVEVDSLFLQVFPFKVIEGNQAKALEKPNSIIITRRLSRKLFGNSSPIGKRIKIFNSLENEVTAVIEEPGSPAHMNVQFAWRSPYEAGNNNWGNESYQTYVKTKQPMSASDLEAAMNPIYYESQLKLDKLNYAQFIASHKTGLFADKVGRIHNFPQHGGSQFPTVTVLLALAFLLLIAGAVNFSNLSIASSLRRAKEVGVRKTLGSGKRQLLAQFLGETALQCVISLAIALLAVNIILPYFERAFDIQLSLFDSGNGLSIALQVAGCLLLVVLLSGLYPAVFLSMLNTTKVLKGGYSTGNKGKGLRNALIVVQFVVAAFFVFGTLVINRQIRYMRDRDRGFKGEQVVRIQATQKSRDKEYDATRAMLMEVPGVINVSKTTQVPGDASPDTSTYTFKFGNDRHRMSSIKITSDYFKTLGIDLVKGRVFDERYADQHTRSVILNETAASRLGVSDPIGKTIYFPYCDTLPVNIIGVVRDLQIYGYEYASQPVAYSIGNEACMFQSGGAILVKLSDQDISSTIAGLTVAWKKIEPDFPIRYSFLDENFERLFASYVRLQSIISIFTVAAILISMIGLFAMTAYLTSRRNKEIGVRKVLGASVTDIASLLSRDFIALVTVAILIAAPLGYWATNEWLQTFAFRITLSWWLFLVSAGSVLLVAIITVGIQTIRAAMANPVNSLRSE